MKNFKKKLAILLLLATLIPTVALAGRTDNAWDNMSTYLKTNAVTGFNILINGLNKYLNFGSGVGESGYGFRDNSGTMQFKNSLGAWTDVGSGGIETETDPVYSASSWFTTTNNSSNWDSAYSWGDHSLAGYLTSISGLNISSLTNDSGYITLAGVPSETDPVYSGSSWFTTTNNSSNWDTAYGWGNHASAGYLTSLAFSGLTDYPANSAGVLTNDGSGNLSWGAGGSMTYPSVGIAVSTGSAWGTSITDNSSNWNTAYSWGNHASAGYVTGTPWTSEGYLTTETDPTIYSWAKASTKPTYTYSEVGAQPAGTYSTDIHSNITALNAVSGTNTGDQTSVSGNAGTATTLQTARTINGVSFNGSSNITVPSDIAPSTSGNVMTSNGSVWTSATPTSSGLVSVSTVVLSTPNTPIGSSTTQFDITNPSGTTFRYTWDGTGTNPSIDATSFPTGSVIDLQAQNFNANNKGIFTVTGSGSNYVEVTNASGVAEVNKTIGTLGFVTKGNLYTKPAGLKYLTVELVGAGESGANTNRGTDTVFSGMRGKGGGTIYSGKGGLATGGDVNVKGGSNTDWGTTTSDRRGHTGQNSYFGGGGWGSDNYTTYGEDGDYGAGGGGYYTNSSSLGGSGGSAGGYSRKTYTNAGLGSTEMYSVGYKGIGGYKDSSKSGDGGNGLIVLTEYY